MKAYLETRDSIVRLESEHLTVRSGQTTGKAKGELLLEIPLLDLEEVIVDETVHMSTPALTALLKRQIPVHFLDFKGGLTGSWLPATRSEGETRLLQYQRTIDTCGFAFSTARSLIEAKLYNQRRMLQRLESHRSVEY